MSCPVLAILQRHQKILGVEDSTTGHLPLLDLRHFQSPGKLRPGNSTLGPCRVLHQLVFAKESKRVAGFERDLQVGAWSKLSADGQLSEAVEALDLLVHQGCHVGNSVFYATLKRCIAQKDLVLGSRVHALAVKSGYASNAFLANHIICMYACHGRLEEATQVFSKVPVPSRHMWASIILAHSRHGQPVQAIQLFRQLRESTVKPDNHLFVAVLNACANAEDLPAGREVHANIIRTEDAPNIFVGNALVDMYSKCGSLEDARSVFDSLPCKNVVTWTAMISGYAHNGHGEDALALYEEMQLEGITPANHVTFVCLLQACARVGALNQGKQLHAQVQLRGLDVDVAIGTCLVDMYAKCGSLEDARRVFDNLQSKDVVTWNAMIAGYAQCGLGQESLAVYARMHQEGITSADAYTFACLLQACGSVSGLEKGKELHTFISKIGLETTDLVVANSLIDMYSKCGTMVNAQQVFDALPKRDTVTWNALIAGYTRQGESDRVFYLLERMIADRVQPNGVTFLSVLTVCNHAGLVDRGREYFEVMLREYGITPTAEHYNCTIDLLGRAGQVEKALEMVQTMPSRPNCEIWKSVLGACRKWKNVELGWKAFQSAVSLHPDDAAIYVLMSNIYADAHMWDYANQIQAMRLSARAWKNPGHSWWTDSAGIVHTFSVGDREHPEWRHIDANLGDILVKLIEVGSLVIWV